MTVTGRRCACVYYFTIAFGHWVNPGEQQ